MYRMTCFHYFFFNDTATTEIYTLSLHDALPIFQRLDRIDLGQPAGWRCMVEPSQKPAHRGPVASMGLPRTPDFSSVLHRSEEHTSELQSRQYLVCRLLLEKKKKAQH